MSIQQIRRSQGRSVVAAAAYRAGEKLYDVRQEMVHDYSRKGGVVHAELLLPRDAPDWVRGVSREQFWNRVDAGEKRKDAQTAREIRVMIPRELSHAACASISASIVPKGPMGRTSRTRIC